MSEGSRRLFTVCLGLALLLNGCGDDGGDAGTDAGTDAFEVSDVPARDHNTQDRAPSDTLPNDVPEGAALSRLFTDAGEIQPELMPDTTDYSLVVGALVSDIRVGASATSTDATIEIEGTETTSGAFSEPIALDVGENLISVQVSVGSNVTAYTLRVTRRSPGAYLKASNTDQEDQFGWSVAMDGDTVVVGAPFEESATAADDLNNGLRFAGAIYVFRREGDGFVQEAYLKAFEPTEEGYFGAIIAIEGDVIVASQQSDVGTVYVYRRIDGVWEQESELTHPSWESGDQAGRSLAVAGNRVAVGVINESGGDSGVGGDPTDNSVRRSGAVFTFTHDGTSWSEEAYIKASTPGESDSFGYGVALSEDTLVASATGEDSQATGVNGTESDNSLSAAGAAYVFEFDGTWGQTAYLKASNTAERDAFGHAVALSGDWVAIGAYGEDSDARAVDGPEDNDNAVNSGAVYVFRRRASGWGFQAYVKAHNTDANDSFGTSVGLFGDQLAVGARNEGSSATLLDGMDNNDAAAAGAVYFYRWDGARWSLRHYVKAPNTDLGDRFGASIDLSATGLVVGAILEDSAGRGPGSELSDNTALAAGAVYVY